MGEIYPISALRKYNNVAIKGMKLLPARASNIASTKKFKATMMKKMPNRKSRLLIVLINR